MKQHRDTTVELSYGDRRLVGARSGRVHLVELRVEPAFERLAAEQVRMDRRTEWVSEYDFGLIWEQPRLVRRQERLAEVAAAVLAYEIQTELGIPIDPTDDEVTYEQRP